MIDFNCNSSTRTETEVAHIKKQLENVERKLNILLGLFEDMNKDTKRKTIAEKYGRRTGNYEKI